MDSVTDKSYVGNWKMMKSQACIGSLKIEKTGETYKCSWVVFNDPLVQHAGVGMVVDERLLVFRFEKEKNNNVLPKGGVGVYRPIGDKRSYSALWTSTQSLNDLGSGIAWSNNISESFEGEYRVRYFLKGHEIPVFNLKINKRESTELYDLSWSIEEELINHGIGTVLNNHMALAYGELSIDCEIAILSIIKQDDKYILQCRHLLQSSNTVHEEILKRD